jgi:hypothetical protein
VLRAILGGFNFTLKLEGIKVRLHGANQIKRQNVDIPELEIDIGCIAIMAAIYNERVAVRILLQEIKMVEYFRREQLRAYSRQVNNNLSNVILTTIYDEIDHLGRGSVQSRQIP